MEAVLSGSSKVAPGWNPENADRYSLESWTKDVRLWAASTDLRADQLGPSVALRLQGFAKTLSREIPTQMLMYGDTIGGTTLSGLDILIKGLEQRFKPLSVETGAKAIAAYFTFRKTNAENIDQAVARWQLIRQRADDQGGLQLSPSGHAWLLLQALQIPATAWIPLLQRFDGTLPSTEDELLELITLIRRQGHLGEKGGLVDIARRPEQLHQQMSSDGLRTTPASTSSQHGQRFLAIADAEPMEYQAPLWPDAPSRSDDISPEQRSQAYSASEQQAYESDYSTDTEAEVHQHLTEEDLYEDEEDDPEEAFLTYLIAKNKWRRFSGPKRRFKHQHKQQHGYPPRFQSHRTRNTGSSPYGARPQRAYPVHGQHTGGNPKGADGQPLRCSHCGSTEHLWRKCNAPGSEEFKKQRLAGGKGKGKGAAGQRPPHRVHFSSSAMHNEAGAVSAAHNLAFITSAATSLSTSRAERTDASCRESKISLRHSRLEEWTLTTPPPPPDHSPRITPRLPLALSEGMGGLPPPKFTSEELETLEAHPSEGLLALRRLSPRGEPDAISAAAAAAATEAVQPSIAETPPPVPSS
eukprot:4119141-Amphidinium_carterae.1